MNGKQPSPRAHAVAVIRFIVIAMRAGKRKPSHAENSIMRMGTPAFERANIAKWNCVRIVSKARCVGKRTGKNLITNKRKSNPKRKGAINHDVMHSMPNPNETKDGDPRLLHNRDIRMVSHGSPRTHLHHLAELGEIQSVSQMRGPSLRPR